MEYKRQNLKEKQYTITLSSSNKQYFTNLTQRLLAILPNKEFASLPMKSKRFTVTRSPHVNNKSKEHFETRMYRRVLSVQLTYFQLKLLLKSIPSYVLIKVRGAGNSAVW